MSNSLAENDLALLNNYIQNGDSASMSKLCETYYRTILNYLSSRINDREDAKDLTGDVFVIFMESASKFSGRSTVKNYLFGIAKNVLSNRYRSDYLNREFVQQSYLKSHNEEGEALDIFDTVSATSVSSEYRWMLFDFLKNDVIPQLGEIYQDIFRLIYIEQYKMGAVAELLGVTENTARQRLFRAKRQANRIVMSSPEFTQLLHKYHEGESKEVRN